MSQQQELDLCNSFWFPQVFQHCGAVAGALFCRLWAYANGSNVCFMTTPKMIKELGEGRRPIETAKSKLEKAGLITCFLEKWDHGVHTKVVINTNHSYLYKGVCTKRTDPTYVQNEHRGMSETNIGVCTKRTDGYVQNAQQGTEINTEKSTEVSTERATAQPQKAKPSKNKPIYPQSKEQCYTLFNEQVNKLINDYPELANININICALKFYNYYSDNNWRTKRGLIKSVERTAQNWLMREIEGRNDKAKDKNSPQNANFALDLVKKSGNNGAPSTINADYEDVTDTPEPPLLPKQKEQFTNEQAKTA